MRGTEDSPRTATPWILVPCEQVGHWRDNVHQTYKLLMNRTKSHSKPIPTGILNHSLPMVYWQSRYNEKTRSHDLRPLYGMNQTALLRTTNGCGFRHIEDESTVIRESPPFQRGERAPRFAKSRLNPTSSQMFQVSDWREVDQSDEHNRSRRVYHGCYLPVKLATLRCSKMSWMKKIAA